MRRTRSSRPRAFPPVHPTPRPNQKIPDADPGHPSRRRNHARLLARPHPEIRRNPRCRKKSRSDDCKIAVRRVRHLDDPAKKHWTLFFNGIIKRWNSDLKGFLTTRETILAQCHLDLVVRTRAKVLSGRDIR